MSSLLVLSALAPALVQDKSVSDLRRSQVSESTGAKNSNEQQIIVNTDLVTLNVSVIDTDGFQVSGLTKQDFVITDNKIPQDITFFGDTDLPLSISIVFDVSGSMSGKKIEQAKEALLTFIQTSHPDDEYSLVGFNSQPQLLFERTRSATSIVEKLSFVEPHGSTALYDASYLALDRLAQGSYPKRAILIISDGQDNDSRFTFSNLQRALKESGAILYAVGIEGSMGGKFDIYGKLRLIELASISGGRVFFPRNTKQMNEAFEQMALELRHQYSIGYRPLNFAVDGKWHRVKVKVTPSSELKRVWVRSREGYYAVR